MSQTTTFTVDGMTCGHCVGSVTSELSALPGVTDVRVELVAGGSSPVVVTSDAPLADEALAAAVVEAGYAITPRRSLL
ncbi:heavy-metal-associated domain-containing protein [Cellulomonas soli]